jgi:signal peptidase I
MRRPIAVPAALVMCAISGCGGSTTTIKTVVQVPAPPLAAYRVPSGSMEPSLSIGTHVWVEGVKSSPAVGDIVVFHPPEGAEQEECGPTARVIRLGGAACSEPIPQLSSVEFIKRIVAGPGDEIYIKEGHVFRKAAGTSQFVAEQDSYIKPCGASPECNFPTPIKIPADDWYTMGDNRGESDDSRFWGPVPTGWIIGVVRWCSQVGIPCPTG